MKTLSTAEKVVGVDVDGSLIYEKTYMANNVNISTSTVLDSAINSNNTRLISTNEAFHMGTNWYPSTNFILEGVYASMYSSLRNNGLQLIVGYYTVKAYHITVRYVKL